MILSGFIKRNREKFRLFYKNLMRFSDRLDNNHTFMLSAGIAFNIMVYMIPLFLLAIFILGRIYDTTEVIHYLEQLINDLFPPTEQSQALAHSVLDEVQKILDHSSFVGIIGIAGLLWLSSTLISSFRISLNTIFNLPSKRIFIFYRLKDILLTLVVTVLIFLYSYAVPISQFIIDFINEILPEFAGNLFAQIALTGAGIITSFVLFYFIFRYVPNRKIPRYIRVFSTVLCVVAIEVSRHLFAWYIVAISNYSKFYGTYAVIISIAIWIYYSSMIILLSAEAGKFVYDLKQSRIALMQSRKIKKRDLEKSQIPGGENSDSK